MKYIITKKSILSTTALIALITMSSSYTYTNHGEVNVERMDSFTKMFMAGEQNFSNYISTNNKTSANTFLVAFKAILDDCKRKFETTTRCHTDSSAKEIDNLVDELMNYGLQYFNILYNIFEKYNGKSSSQATALATELKKEFDTEKIFSEMIIKLKVLKSKAAHAENKHLVKKIEYLMQLIQKKKSEWNAKPEWSIYAGIRYRMDCK